MIDNAEVRKMATVALKVWPPDKLDPWGHTQAGLAILANAGEPLPQHVIDAQFADREPWTALKNLAQYAGAVTTA